MFSEKNGTKIGINVQLFYSVTNFNLIGVLIYYALIIVLNTS